MFFLVSFDSSFEFGVRLFEAVDRCLLYRERVQTGANYTGNKWRTEELLKEEVTGL